MEEVVLKAERRNIVGKQVKALRRSGRLPAVIYGKGITPITIDLDLHDTSRLLPGLSSSQLIVVDLNGEQHSTLIREKQRDPVSGSLKHIDFLEVSLTEKLRTDVVIVLVGTSPAVKELNAVIVTGLESLQVEALPGDLPGSILVDISSLKEIGQAIHVRDIPAIPNVEFLDDADEMVVLVIAPETEEEVGLGEETGGEEPEVIEKGKKEEEF